MKTLYVLFLLTFLKSSALLGLEAPRRIVSTSLASDEVLLSLLGKEERKRVVAVSKFAGDPKYSSIKNVSGIKVYDDAVESIVVSQPDLVIMASFNKAAVRSYVQKNKIRHLLLSRFDSIADIKRNILEISTVIGKRKSGRRLVKQMDRKLNAIVQSKKPKPKVLSLSSGYVTMGSKSLFADIVRKAGGYVMAKDLKVENWGKVSEEKLLAQPPDLIVLASSVGRKTNEIPLWLKNSSLAKLRKPELASRLCYIDEPVLLSTSHFIVEAVQKLNECIQKWQK